MKTGLAELIEVCTVKYPAAPITEPEHIKDEAFKNVVITLVKSGNAVPSTDIPVYELPEEDKRTDYRPAVKRLWHKLFSLVATSRRIKKLEKRIEEVNLMRQTQGRYAWLESAHPIVGEAISALRKSHQDTASYISETNRALEEAKELIAAGDKDLEGLAEEISIAKADIQSSAYQDYIKSNFGEETLKSTLEKLEEDVSERKKRIPEVIREKEYISRLLKHYSGILVSCMATLSALEEATEKASEQRMDIERTLQTYRGLTRNQIRAVNAISFLDETNKITKELKEGISDVDSLFHRVAESYSLAPADYTPAPDPELSQARTDLKRLKE